MLLLSIFAAVSLVLAVVGTYGVMAYTVSARTPELGVRIALGATTSNVLGLVVGQSMLTSTLGIAAGVAAAVALTRTIRGMLYGVGANRCLNVRRGHERTSRCMRSRSIHPRPPGHAHRPRGSTPARLIALAPVGVLCNPGSRRG